MALAHKFTLVCDDVRREDNGKLLVIGMYTPGITLPKLPFRMPKIVFLSYFEVTAPGAWDMGFRFSHVGTGALVGAEGTAKIQVSAVMGPIGSVVLPLTIQNPQFQMPGDYVLTLSGEGFEGVAVTVPVSQRTASHVH
jgi:hypothetical protein